MITIAEKIFVTDKHECTYPVKIEVEDSGYIADIFVRFPEHIKVSDFYAWDDEKIIESLMKYFKSIGYNGKTFDRSEMGLQGEHHITLEPPDEFEDFLIEKFGYTDLNRTKKQDF